MKKNLKKLIIYVVILMLAFTEINAQPNAPINNPDTGKAQYYQNMTPRKVRILNFNRYDSNVVGTKWFKNSVHSYENATQIQSSDIDSLIPSTSELGQIHYFVVITFKNYVSTSNIKTIEIIPNPSKPSIAVQPSTEALQYCKGDLTNELSIKLKDAEYLTPIYSWYISNSNDVDNVSGVLIGNANSSTLKVSTNIAGTHYYYAVVGFKGSNLKLTSAFSGPVVVKNKPKVEITSSVPANNKTVTINNNTLIKVSAQGASEYNWNTPNTVIDPLASSTYLLNNVSEVVLSGVDENGCVGTDTLKIVRNQSGISIFVKNIFTPSDQNNLNDVLEVTVNNNNEHKPVELTVYDMSSGNLVYQSNDYKNNWRGTNTNGSPLIQGVYKYYVSVGGYKSSGVVTLAK